MTEEYTIRLKNVMTEFNVGFATIREYLDGKGFFVDTPNAKISDEAYRWISKDFGSELLVKELAQKIGIRKVRDAFEEDAEPPVVEEIKKELPIEKKSVDVPKPEPVIVAPKIVGKIEIETIETPAKEPAKESRRQKEREKRKQKLAEDAARQAEGAAKIKALLKKDKPKDEDATTSVDQSPTEKEEIKNIETIVTDIEQPKVLGRVDLNKLGADITKHEDWIEMEKRRERNKAKHQRNRERKKRMQDDLALSAAQREREAEAEKPKAQQEPPKSRAERERERVEYLAELRAAAKEKLAAIFGRNKPTENEDAPKSSSFIPTQVETLSGLKIVDNIDLTKIMSVRPDAHDSNDASPLRGKRKRIRGNAVDIKDIKDVKDNRGQYPRQDTKKKEQKKDKDKGYKNKKRPLVSVAEVEQKLKETLAKMMEKGTKTKTSKYRREKREAVSEKLQAQRDLQSSELKTLELTEFVTANDLSKMMDISVNEIIDACMNLGLMVSLNQRLDAEAIALIVENFGYKASFVSSELQIIVDEEEGNPADLKPRAPIVTVMGHVDHGKTSLIDNIRKTNIIAGEAGGITQHIGAYHVDLPNGRQITFLDTPGHEAFTAMRARGAKATDVVIIIVSADDSVMPQTVEAINHAVAAGVPMIFAINKIDKPGAAPDKIREQLAKMNYLVEDWGGKYQVQEIAAKSGVNVDKLLEKILVETDLLELKANPKLRAKGVIIESLLEKGRGYISRVLVHNGTLRVGDIMLSGQHVGKIKAMFNERGKKITEAGPSIPVEILGLNGATTAGDTFAVMEDEREARSIASQREQLQRLQGLRTQKHITLDEIGRRIAIGNFKELNIIVKADVDGSKEALTDSLLKLSTEQVQLNVIHSGVGAISESDVQLAAAAEAIIVCFQVRPSPTIRKSAEHEGIEIRTYSIIYDAINEIKAAIEGMHTPEYKEKIVCAVEVLQVYNISKVGAVAGCIVRDGKITRQTKLRVIRDGIVIHTGKLDSLKRFKDDVKEVALGFECGLNIVSFNDIQVGDIIEGYEMEEV
jgi:translation initiation factor IF-2